MLFGERKATYSENYRKNKSIMWTEFFIADPGGRALQDMGVKPLNWWDRAFESC
jgi:hypothetical protein